MWEDKIKEKFDLRIRAEKILKTKADRNLANYSEADHLKLLHELEVSRIEIDLQEEEIAKAKAEYSKINQEYDKLSDLHTRFIVHVLKKGRI